MQTFLKLLIIKIKNFFYYLFSPEYFFKQPTQLDICITAHCNLSCKCCNHFSPIANPQFVDIKELENNLKIINKKGNHKLFKLIHIIGGEPLLHPNIIEIIELVSRYFDRNYTLVKIMTNGVLLDKMSDDFWSTVYKHNIKIAITKYPININYEHLKYLCRKKNILFEIFGDRSNNLAFKEYRLNKKFNINLFYRFHNYFKCDLFTCLQLVGNKIYSCPISAHINHINNKLKTNYLRQTISDYISIDNLNKLNLLTFMLRPKHFCGYCKKDRIGIDWSTSSKKIDEWLE